MGKIVKKQSRALNSSSIPSLSSENQSIGQISGYNANSEHRWRGRTPLFEYFRNVYYLIVLFVNLFLNA